jgi:hypothetical protein
MNERMTVQLRSKFPTFVSETHGFTVLPQVKSRTFKNPEVVCFVCAFCF